MSRAWMSCLLFGLGLGLGCSDDESAEGSSTTSDETGDTGDTGETGDEPLPGSCETPIPAQVLADARLSLAPGGVLRDALGRDVVMRGINTGGRSKTAPFVPFPIAPDAAIDEVRSAADEFFARLRAWGLDTVRLPFSWDALEPARDVWDEQYLDRYEAMVDAAWDQGLRVIVDYHQDIYAESYCGDGFPLWSADPNAPAAECPNIDWFLEYATNDGVRASFDRFWANEDQLIDEFEVMWLRMAERFADHPGVIALEIINEPGWGTANDIQQWKLDVLTPFHDQLISLLHEAAPDLLIAYDNPGIDGVVGLVPNLVHPRPNGEFLLYAPHLYGAATWGPGQPDPSDYLLGYADFGRNEGVHVLLGEFGIQIQDSAGPEWLRIVAEAIDRERVSATMWEYSQNEVQWNYENYSVVDPAGNERSNLDPWVRPWLRAVAGDSPSFEWDALAGVGSASWVSDGGVSEIVLPSRLFGAAPSNVGITGEGACFTLDPERGELRVTAPAGVGVTVDLGLD